MKKIVTKRGNSTEFLLTKEMTKQEIARLEQAGEDLEESDDAEFMQEDISDEEESESDISEEAEEEEEEE